MFFASIEMPVALAVPFKPDILPTMLCIQCTCWAFKFSFFYAFTASIFCLRIYSMSSRDCFLGSIYSIWFDFSSSNALSKWSFIATSITFYSLLTATSAPWKSGDIFSNSNFSYSFGRMPGYVVMHLKCDQNINSTWYWKIAKCM